MVGQYPRLRVHVRKGRNGQVYTYHYYDMRPEGKPDINLGKDRAKALAKWDEIHNRRPQIVGTVLEAFEAWEQQELPRKKSDETRRGYRKNLAWLKAKFGGATWDGVTLRDLKQYLRSRKGKVQANREIALFSQIWRWAQGEYTDLPWPAAGLEKSRWKNEEGVREYEVQDRVWFAIYAEADQRLKDGMDVASATGLRLKDVLRLTLPKDGLLHIKANKTSKRAAFDLSLSEVLPGLIERRKTYKATHLMLLSEPDGAVMTYAKLRGSYDKARAAAAAKALQAGDEELAGLIKAMWLRDARRFAADLAESDEEAAELLQHGSVGLTRKHYRRKGNTLKPVR